MHAATVYSFSADTHTGIGYEAVHCQSACVHVFGTYWYILYVRMCACVYIRTYISTCTYVRTYAHADVCCTAYEHVDCVLYLCVHVFVAYVRARGLCVVLYLCMYVYRYMCISVWHIRTCVHVDVCMHFLQLDVRR